MNRTGRRYSDRFAATLQLLYVERVQAAQHGARSLRLVESHHRDIGEAVLADAGRAEALMREHVEGFMTLAVNEMPYVLDQLIDWR